MLAYNLSGAHGAAQGAGIHAVDAFALQALAEAMGLINAGLGEIGVDLGR